MARKRVFGDLNDPPEFYYDLDLFDLFDDSASLELQFLKVQSR